MVGVGQGGAEWGRMEQDGAGRWTALGHVRAGGRSVTVGQGGGRQWGRAAGWGKVSQSGAARARVEQRAAEWARVGQSERHDGEVWDWW